MIIMVRRYPSVGCKMITIRPEAQPQLRYSGVAHGEGFEWGVIDVLNEESWEEGAS